MSTCGCDCDPAVVCNIGQLAEEVREGAVQPAEWEGASTDIRWHAVVVLLGHPVPKEAA